MAYRFPTSNRDGTPKGTLVVTSRGDVERIAPVDARRCVLVMRNGDKEWIDVSSERADKIFDDEYDNVERPDAS